jgi:hypothetical protein
MHTPLFSALFTLCLSMMATVGLVHGIQHSGHDACDPICRLSSTNRVCCVRKMFGDRPPLASRAQYRPDLVHELTDVDPALVAAAPRSEPFLIGQVARISQSAAVISLAVFGRPHRHPAPNHLTTKQIIKVFADRPETKLKATPALSHHVVLRAQAFGIAMRSAAASPFNRWNVATRDRSGTAREIPLPPSAVAAASPKAARYRPRPLHQRCRQAIAVGSALCCRLRRLGRMKAKQIANQRSEPSQGRRPLDLSASEAADRVSGVGKPCSVDCRRSARPFPSMSRMC